MTLLLVLIAVSTIASILMSGANHPHYLIQAMPVFALLAVAWIAYLPQRAVVSVWCFTILSLVPSGIPTLQEYQGLISRWQARQDLRYGSAYKIAAHLRRENPSGRPVYLLTDHVVYWLNGMTPPTRLATHPSAFAKPFVASALGTTGTDELTAVFRQSPEFVVLPECADWIDLDLSRKLDAYLQAGYMLEARIDGRYLYRRSSGGQPTGAAVNPTLPWRQC